MERLRSSDVVAVHQTLHGYDGGHSLLAASTRLPSEASYLLLAMSDLSGPRPMEGFSGYLTAYPLLGTEFYALSRTWLAPESQRPGSVWTHTLLVRLADVEYLENLARLIHLHHRPGPNTSGQGGWEYNEPLALEESDVSLSIDIEAHANVISTGATNAKGVVKALYGSSDAPVVVAARTAKSSEGLFIALWEQQWPALRRNFCFCTGALAVRSIAGKPFDLIASPEIIAPLIAREVHGTIAESTIDYAGEDPLWLQVVVRDVAGDSRHSLLRQMLRLAATDDQTSRGFMMTIATLTSAVQQAATNAQKTTEVVDAVAHAFPDASAGTRLKRALFGRDQSSLPIELPEPTVLAALATTQHPAAFDPYDLGIRDRASAVWRYPYYEVRSLLAQLRTLPPNLLREEILEGIANGVPDEEFARAAAEIPGLLYDVVREQPSIAERTDVWLISTTAPREILSALESMSPNSFPDSQAVFSAAINSGAPSIARDLVRLFSARSCLRSFVQSPVNPIATQTAADWLQVAREHKPELKIVVADSRIGAAPQILAVIAATLDPSDARTVDLTSWARTAGELCSMEQIVPQVRIAAFLLGIALDSADVMAALLLADMFPIVHEAAARERIDDESWRLLAQRMPDVPKSIRWDRCERLRRAAFEAFRSRPEWPAEILLMALQTNAALPYTLAYAVNAPNSEEMLRRMAIAAGTMPGMPDELRRAVEKAASGSRRKNALQELTELLFDIASKINLFDGRR